MNKNYDICAGAKRLENVKFSPIRQVLDKAAEMRNNGIDVISLSVGEPDFNTPEMIKKKTIESIQNNDTHYGSNRGLPELRKIISDDFYKENNVRYDWNTEVVFTTGGAEALNNVILATVNKDDEVIVFSPAFVSYKNLVNLCGGKCIELPLKPENDYIPDIKELENVITDKTKMLIMNNPNNPTGAVYPVEVLGEIAKLAISNNFLILADEMYSKLVYEGDFVSMASLPNMKEHVIIVNGFSKTYAMTGWRLGYLLADSRIVTNIMKVHQYSSTCSPTFIQKGMAAAIKKNETEADVQNMIKQFKLRRNVLINELNNIEKIKFVEPKGAFYVLIDVSATGFNGEEFAARLLRDEHVAVVPVVSMGKDKVYDDYIRISFAASEDNIRNGIRAIGRLADSMK